MNSFQDHELHQFSSLKIIWYLVAGLLCRKKAAPVGHLRTMGHGSEVNGGCIFLVFFFQFPFVFAYRGRKEGRKGRKESKEGRKEGKQGKQGSKEWSREATKGEGGARRERWKMEGEKTGMIKRQEMILRPLLSALCFQHCCRSRSIPPAPPNLTSNLSEHHGGRRCALPPNPPPAFLNIIFFHTRLSNSLSLFGLCPSPPQPFFHTHIWNYISLFSVHL